MADYDRGSELAYDTLYQQLVAPSQVFTVAQPEYIENIGPEKKFYSFTHGGLTSYNGGKNNDFHPEQTVSVLRTHDVSGTTALNQTQHYDYLHLTPWFWTEVQVGYASSMREIIEKDFLGAFDLANITQQLAWNDTGPGVTDANYRGIKMDKLQYATNKIKNATGGSEIAPYIVVLPLSCEPIVMNDSLLRNYTNTGVVNSANNPAFIQAAYQLKLMFIPDKSYEGLGFWHSVGTEEGHTADNATWALVYLSPCIKMGGRGENGYMLNGRMTGTQWFDPSDGNTRLRVFAGDGFLKLHPEYFCKVEIRCRL